MLSLMPFPALTRGYWFRMFTISAPMCMTRLVIARDLREFRYRCAMTYGAPWGAIDGTSTEDSRGSERAGRRSQARVCRRLLLMAWCRRNRGSEGVESIVQRILPVDVTYEPWSAISYV